MDGAREDLLARAGLPEQQDRHLRAGNACESLELTREVGVERREPRRDRFGGARVVPACPSRRVLLDLPVEEERLADVDHIAVAQRLRGERLAVHQGPVRRAGVLDVERPVPAEDPDVGARDPRVCDLEHLAAVVGRAQASRVAAAHLEGLQRSERDPHAASVEPGALDHEEQVGLDPRPSGAFCGRSPLGRLRCHGGSVSRAAWASARRGSELACSVMDPGALVGSLFERRYRVDRVVAEGGFGIVYAAVHLALQTPVALKVLRPQRALSRDAWTDLIHQFREEATALTRLRRSSVAAVLDSGIAALDDDPLGLPWMALEWLDGETLKEYFAARRGRGGQPRAACMELLRPVLETIAEAHEQGIVHRDLKPSNIMMVPGKSGVVPRVLDFGIAKMMERGHDGAAAADTATDSRLPAFTASSAAPEQLAGSRTGPWTDVYGLALLITEAVTDRPPIATEDPHERHRIAFAEVRPTPASMGVDVGAWEAVLARALAVKPPDRQRDARALLEQLDLALHDDVPLRRDHSAVPATRDKRRPFARIALAAVGAGAISLVAVGVARRASHDSSTVVATSSARPFVVVSEFRARQGDPRIAAAFGELLSAQLRVGDAMRGPAPDARPAMLDASGLDSASSIDATVLARLRAATAADVLVGGEIDSTGATLHATIELYDTARGTRTSTLRLSAPAGDLNAFVREAGARVRRGLARPTLSIEDETALRSTLPDHPDASMAYVSGLAARRRFLFREAAVHLERATQLAPSFAPAFSALAHARLMLGSQETARQAAEHAVKLAPSLPRGDELLVYALAAETRHDWETAVENYRALAQFYPDRVDYVTSLARALVSAGKAPDALALLDKTRARPQSDWDLLRIQLLASFAHARRSDTPASIAAAKEAEQLAVKIGARVPMADALLAQAHGHHRAGRLDEAVGLFDRARAVYAEVGDTDNLLNCDTALAEIASLRGDFPRAIAIGETIVEAHRASGNLYRRARVTVALCLFHAGAGTLAKARVLCDQGGQLYVQAHDREGEAWSLLNLADLDVRLGQLDDGVADRLTRARAIFTEIEQQAGVAAVDGLRAHVAWFSGRLTEAEAGFDKAFAEAGTAGEAGLQAEISLHRARFAWSRKAASERARFDEASKLVAASSDARLGALLDVHAAQRALASGDLVEARNRAAAAEVAARKAHASDAIALALAVALDAFAREPDAAHAARRTELASRVEQLEPIEPQVDALLALSRATRGPASSELAARARKVARAHGFVVLARRAR
ncbi:MAG: protein kinase [Kofleriaceae bacterium]